MITILSLYCNFKGWQGGTIHQAIEDFDRLDAKNKKKFCDIVEANKKHLTDDYNFKYFACNKIKYHV